jgi:hypothetical protein
MYSDLTGSGWSIAVCKAGKCPGGINHYQPNTLRNRIECNLQGVDLPQISSCPIIDRQKEAIARGFVPASNLCIEIRGWEELWKLNPEKYDKFQEKIRDLIIATFPGVSGRIHSAELTDQHKAEQEARERAWNQETENALLKALAETYYQRNRK